MADSVVLLWREEKSSARRRWFVRGVYDDGSFYGTYEVYGTRGGNLEGQLSGEDNAKFQAAVGRIRRAHPQRSDSDKASEWQGRLAVGPVTAATVVFDYRTGDERSSSSAGDFLEIVSILRAYVECQIGP
jgi:hypothetical protein